MILWESSKATDSCWRTPDLYEWFSELSLIWNSCYLSIDIYTVPPKLCCVLIRGDLPRAETYILIMFLCAVQWSFFRLSSFYICLIHEIREWIWMLLELLNFPWTRTFSHIVTEKKTPDTESISVGAVCRKQRALL